MTDKTEGGQGEADCPYCRNERVIETDNNGPIGPCPVCRPGGET